MSILKLSDCCLLEMHKRLQRVKVDFGLNSKQYFDSDIIPLFASKMFFSDNG